MTSLPLSTCVLFLSHHPLPEDRWLQAWCLCPTQPQAPFFGSLSSRCSGSPEPPASSAFLHPVGPLFLACPHFRQSPPDSKRAQGGLQDVGVYLHTHQVVDTLVFRPVLRAGGCVAPPHAGDFGCVHTHKAKHLLSPFWNQNAPFSLFVVPFLQSRVPRPRVRSRVCVTSVRNKHFCSHHCTL